MRVVEHTSTKLVLRDPEPPGGSSFINAIIALFGLPFVGIGLVMVLWLWERTVLQCDRPTPAQVQCTLTRHRPLGQVTLTMPGIESARVEELLSDEGGSTYRVVLQTPGGMVPLSESFSSGRSPKQRRVDAINAFLGDRNQPQIILEQDNRWVAVAVGGLILAIGTWITVGAVLSLRPQHCILNRETNQGQWSGPLENGVPQKHTFELSDIFKLDTKLTDGQPAETYLLLRTGHQLLLLTDKSIINHEALIQAVQEFLAQPSPFL